MKNLIIILCLMNIWGNQDVFAQNNSTKARLLKKIAETEAEIERLQGKQTNPDSVKTFCFEEVVYKKIEPMTNEEFETFCKKEMPNLTNHKKMEGNYSIISSCKQTPNGLHANFCIATTPDVVNSTPSVNNDAKEKELLKIRNTKKMYIDLIESLNKELQNNGIEIVDQSVNLAVKHIDIDGPTGDVITGSLSDLKDNMIVQLRDKYNLDENIKNENAQLVDDMANQAERLMSMIPGGEIITSHYLWRIFKSTPELGKMIGHTGAMIHIYFQIDEFQKKLKQLEDEENRVLNLK